ncbi:hypothetical protein [Maricaulis sp.]|uniref:hypothetical protein n=1 Tax=Maricaulis sp. TaxID=1486257 RepID=UPI001B00BE02|nr:hypothetical protein [Maricaulis sp.]MBO6796359.1 hypothetical protein [Maricaulis sp.]
MRRPSQEQDFRGAIILYDKSGSAWRAEARCGALGLARAKFYKTEAVVQTGDGVRDRHAAH